MRIRYRYLDYGARDATKELRKRIGKEARAASKAVAERKLVPPARRRAPSLYAGRVVAHATARGAGVKVNARRTSDLNGIAGWLEFGGTIRAKSDQLLTFKVGGRWVRVRVVRRTFVKTGRYVGKAMRDPAVVRGATEEVKVELSKVLDRILGGSARVTR